MKERIIRFVLGIREKWVRVGCWVLAVIGLFLMLFILYSVTIGRISAVLAVKMAVYETLAFAALIFVHRFYIEVLDKIASKTGIIYYSGTHELIAKPEIFRARILRHQGDFAGAVKAFRKLLVRFPGRIDLLYEIGDIYRKDLGDRERALWAYREVAKRPEEGEYAYLVREARLRIEELEGRESRSEEGEGDE
jgi:hypothetical protein